MPARFVTPPIPIWGLTNAGVGEQLLLQCFNNAAAVLQHGDVVSQDSSAGQMPAAPGAVTGAVTVQAAGAKSPLVLGPVSVTTDSNTSAATLAAGATCFVCVGGLARVQITSNAVAAAGNAMQGSGSTNPRGALNVSAAGNAALAAGDIGTVFGIALEAAAARDANNTIRCIIRAA